MAHYCTRWCQHGPMALQIESYRPTRPEWIVDSRHRQPYEYTVRLDEARLPCLGDGCPVRTRNASGYCAFCRERMR